MEIKLGPEHNQCLGRERGDTRCTNNREAKFGRNSKRHKHVHGTTLCM